MFDSLFTAIINNILQPAIYLVFALALLFFLYGVFEFIKNADSEEARDTGRRHMIWGIVGMFIMISAKGIINFILATITLK